MQYIYYNSISSHEKIRITRNKSVENGANESEIINNEENNGN